MRVKCLAQETQSSALTIRALRLPLLLVNSFFNTDKLSFFVYFSSLQIEKAEEEKQAKENENENKEQKMEVTTPSESEVKCAQVE